MKLTTQSMSKKTDEELTPVAWHPIRVWKQCMSQYENKEVESFLIDEKQHKGWQKFSIA